MHTDLGHRCRGARVDGRVVPLSTPLANGQTVEITAKVINVSESVISRAYDEQIGIFSGQG